MRIGLITKITTTIVGFKIVHDNYGLKRPILAKSIDNEKLVSVILIGRHGARTPIKLFEPIEQAEYKAEILEPYVKARYVLKTLDNKEFQDYISSDDQRFINRKLKGGAVMAQLTQVGEKQMFDLGADFKRKYVDELKFLSKDYDPSEIYVRSTHIRRTINSAKSFLAGLYLGSPNIDSNTPFIINLNEVETDYLYPNPLLCRKLKSLFKNMLKSESSNVEHINLVNSIKAIYNIGNDVTDIDHALLDDTNAREGHGFHIPDELIPIMHKARKIATKKSLQFNKDFVDISIGLFLDLIEKNINESIDSDRNSSKSYKLRYYSAHDTTLNAILLALDLIDIENPSWPPFASNITIEIWKNADLENQYTVKVLFAVIKLEGREEAIFKLDDFVKLLQKNSVKEQSRYLELCDSN